MDKLQSFSIVKNDVVTQEDICIVCGKGNNLIRNISHDSCEKLIDSILIRAKFADVKYVKIAERLEKLENKSSIVWHRDCFDTTRNKTLIARLEEKYHRQIDGEEVKRGRKRKSSDIVEEFDNKPITRSKTDWKQIEDLDSCIICAGTEEVDELLTLSTEEAAQQAWEAAQLSTDAQMKFRLDRFHREKTLIGRKYHKCCWRRDVFHVLRAGTNGIDEKGDASGRQNCALIETMSLLDAQTQNGSYICMDAVESTYLSLLGGNTSAHVPSYKRKWLRKQISIQLPHLESVRQPDRSKSALLFSPTACQDEMVFSTIDARQRSSESHHRTLLDSAKVLRRKIESYLATLSTDRTLSLTTELEDSTMPSELVSFFRWLLAGPIKSFDDASTRAKHVQREAVTLAQNVIYAFKTSRQINIESNSTFRHRSNRETPQVQGLSLAVHQSTRSKDLVELLHNIGLGIPYHRVLQLETSIASAISENVKSFGIYIQPWLQDAFVWFAIDNIDFSEDTADGKNTTHGGIIAVNQFKNSGDCIAPKIEVKIDCRNTEVAPQLTREPVPCGKPNKKDCIPFMKNREPYMLEHDRSDEYYLSEREWAAATHISRFLSNEKANVPSLVPYLASTGTTRRQVLTGAQPIIPEPVTEWSTLNTMLDECTKIRQIAVGDEYPTVISMDMAIYEKVILLYDTKVDMHDKYVIRLGELHATMAALRAIGKSIDNSGIEKAWSEADVYGPATTLQILNCKHYRRSVTAHVYSYLALSDIMYSMFFADHPGLREQLEESTRALNASYTSGGTHATASEFRSTLESSGLFERMDSWISSRAENSAMFQSMMNYLSRVEILLAFIVSTRDADVELHIKAAEDLAGLFFAYDRLKYMRLWPRYLADMKALASEHPGVWYQLLRGAVSVTVSDIPLVGIGVDNSCEMMVRQLKTGPGLTGISNDANARNRFLTAGPYLSVMCEEFRAQFVPETTKRGDHHGLSPASIRTHHAAITKIKTAILSHGNPFSSEGPVLYNIITNVCIPEKYVERILKADEVGQQLFEEYVDERINGDVSLWTPIKKNQNAMYRCNDVIKACKVENDIINLKATTETQARLILAAKTRQLDLKDTIGQYELNVLPLAFFNSDGSLCKCLKKAFFNSDGSLCKCLKKADLQTVLVNRVQHEENTDVHLWAVPRTAIVDGMALLRQVKSAETVSDLCHQFLGILATRTRFYSKTIVVFDKYLEKSLKTKIRLERAGGEEPIRYRIEPDTKIPAKDMKQFFGHNLTKRDLITHLKDQILALSTLQTQYEVSNYPDDGSSNHEEADSLIPFHVIAESKCASAITVFAEDTDILVMLIGHHEKIAPSTTVTMTLKSGTVNIGNIVTSLGPVHARGLIGLHAMTGSDCVGRFSGKGKSTWFTNYLQTDDECILNAIISLGNTDTCFEELIGPISEFVCQCYIPSSCTEKPKTMCELRWFFYRAYLGGKDMPPTEGALRQHLLRARLQATVWEQVETKLQTIPDPLSHGYKLVDDQYHPVPQTVDKPGPDAVLQLIRCKCKGKCQTRRCPCRAAGLDCTDMCLCPEDCVNDPDSQHVSSNNAEESDNQPQD